MVSVGCNHTFQCGQCQSLRGGIMLCAALFLLVRHSQLPVESDLWHTMLFQVREGRYTSSIVLMLASPLFCLQGLDYVF